MCTTHRVVSAVTIIAKIMVKVVPKDVGSWFATVCISTSSLSWLDKEEYEDIDGEDMNDEDDDGGRW